MHKLLLALALFAQMAMASENLQFIQTEHFAIRLPETWAATTTTEPGFWQYTNPGSNEALSISVMKATPSTSPQDRVNRLNEFLSARLKTEREQAQPGEIELTEPKIQSQGAALIATYSGFQRNKTRRFLTFVVINSKRLVCFYFEALDTTEASFKQRQREILGTVQVAD